MKKVLFVIRELRGGGAERALSNIVMHLPRDWEIDILLNDSKLVEFPYRGNLLSLGIKNKNGKFSPLSQIWAIAKRTFVLRKLKKEKNYNACVSFLDSANISNVLSGNKWCKTIVSIRVSMISEQSKLHYRMAAFPLIKLLYSRADKIVTVSKEIEGEIREAFHLSDDKVTTIVNGYDCGKIEKQAQVQLEQMEAILNCRLVVTAGRLDEQKGQWHLIRAFRKVVDEVPEAKLVILGAGKLMEYYRQLIQANGVQNSVILAGFCENPFWYYKKADVFILPSMFEGYPNVLAEAVCCNVACIATDFHSGAREILAPQMYERGPRISERAEEEYGILVPLCSGKMYKGNEPLEVEEMKMAETIIMLLKDDEKRAYYQEQSRKRSIDLDIEAVVQKWIAEII